MGRHKATRPPVVIPPGHFYAFRVADRLATGGPFGGIGQYTFAEAGKRTVTVSVTSGVKTATAASLFTIDPTRPTKGVV